MSRKTYEDIILIKGAGDLASGVAARLLRSGYSVVMTEIQTPMMVRRSVSFGEAIYEGVVRVEDLTAEWVKDIAVARLAIKQNKIPILIDPQADCRFELHPIALIDAIMAKRNTGTQITDAACVIGLGPGFCAGKDCHIAIETNRGHFLGRVITEGYAEPDTGSPGNVVGKTEERILRAPTSGIVEVRAKIGDLVTDGQTIAFVQGQPVYARISGVLRGLLRDGIYVSSGTKMGDIDPRAEPSHCVTISEKAYAIAGGVLEALLSAGILPPQN